MKLFNVFKSSVANASGRHRRTKHLRGVKFLAVLALALAGSWYLWMRAPTEVDRSVVSAKIAGQEGVPKMGDLVQMVNLSGSVLAARSAFISAPYAGYIKKLYVATGGVVRPGDPLVALSQLPSSRVEELNPILSPVAGRVVHVMKREGEYIEQAVGSGGANPTGTIMRIDDTSRFYMEADVPESDYARISVGQPVDIKVMALPGESYKGHIETIALAAKSQSQWERSRVEFTIRIVFDNSDSKLKSGMSATASVIIKEIKNTMLIGLQYVKRAKDQYIVTKADGSNTRVEVGEKNDEYFEIKSGITTNDRLKLIDFSAM
jgi:multidrug efflux pump subunit AcrA (membrane-fusion protein)